MSVHTPGPWELIEQNGHHREIKDADGWVIMAERDYGEVTPTNHADWRLMACAPELLEALMQAECFMQTFYMHAFKGERNIVDDVTWQRVVAAIDKATGKP